MARLILEFKIKLSLNEADVVSKIKED